METVEVKKPAVKTENVTVSKPAVADSIPSVKDRKVLSASQALAKSPDEIVKYYDVGVTAPIDADLNARFSSNKQVIAAEQFDAARAENKDATEALTQIYKGLSEVEYLKSYLDPGMATLITSADPANREYATKKLTKLAIAYDKIQKKVQSTSPGYLGKAGDFVDSMLSGVPIYSTIVARANEKFADRFQELISMDVPLDVLEKELDVALTEAADAGLFTEENSFFLGDLIDTMAYGSGSNVANFNEALSWIDIGGALAGAPKLIKGATKTAGAVKDIKRVSGLGTSMVTDFGATLGLIKRNPDELVKLLDRAVIMDDVSRSAIKVANQTSSLVTPLTKRPTFLAPSNKEALRIWELESRSMMDLKKVQEYAGKALDEAAVEGLRVEFKTTAAAKAAETGSKRFIDSDIIVDDFENIIHQEFIGRTNGTAFVGPRGLKAAEKLAENLGSGYEVRPYTNANEWVVVKESNVPVDVRGFDFALFKATPTEELRAGPIVKYLGSSHAQMAELQDTILKQGEAAKEIYKQTQQRSLSLIKKSMPKKELNEIFAVEAKVRDDASIKQALSEPEFKDKFFQLHGKQPTKAQVTAYLVERDMMDTLAMINADRRFKELVGQKAVVVDGALAKPVNKADVKAGKKVWDEDKGELLDVADVNNEYQIYANLEPLDGSMRGGALYYTRRTPDVRRVFHSDVMQYNPGGSRMYERNVAQRFVKQARDVELSDGTSVSVSPLTVMAVRTEKEAVKATTQLNNIITAIQVKVGTKLKKSGEVADAIKALSKKDKDELSDVISANKEWNPNYYDVDTLLEWAKDNGVNLGKKFDHVGDGKRIVEDGEVWGVDESATYGDAFRANAFKSYSRKDSVLVGYGGQQLPTVDPKASLERSLMQATTKATERAYMTSASNGFLKSAMDNKVLTNVRDLRGLPLRQKVMQAEIDTSTVSGKRLELERQKIVERMNGQTYIAKQWDNATTSLSNFLYDRGFEKTSNFVNKFDKDPLTALRGYVFDAKLGFFNYDQFWVQGMAAFDVMAIGGMNGVKGTALYSPVRFALANGHDAVIRKFGGLISKVSGLSEQQFSDMVKFLRESGRSIVGVDLSEFGDDASQASMLFAKTREKGRFFFKEGELISRIAAHNTAFIEFYAKFGADADPFLEANKRWITRRQDILTRGMTAASKSSIENLPFAQFLSYSFRINEALFSGSFGIGKKILTNKEKARLAIAHTAMYGAAGWTGFNFVADRLEHLYGTPINENSYNLIRKGVIDYILSNVTGVETDLSSRLGPGEGIFTILMDMAEKNAFEFFLGPSGQLGTSAFSSIVGLAKDLATFNGTLAAEDMMLLLREVKTANVAYNAYIGFYYDEARTKSGSVLYDTNNTEVLLKTLGIPLEKETDIFRYVNQTKIDKYFIESYTKSIQKLQNNFEAAYRVKDWEEAKKWSRRMGFALNKLDPLTRQKVSDKLRVDSLPMLDSLGIQAFLNETHLLEGY